MFILFYENQPTNGLYTVVSAYVKKNLTSIPPPDGAFISIITSIIQYDLDLK